jgi:NADPH-ferrihemoprotein reductase
VFGLGNRQYEHFNKQGKLTNKNMTLLGATRMHTYGEGDDDGTLEEDFENWREKLWPAVTEKFGLANGGDTGRQDGTVKKINLNFRTKNVSGGRPKSPPASQMNSSTKHFFTAASALVVENKELRSGRSEHGR